jgi:unsaturated rhamnogalacturonyl hydrolase
MTSDATSHLSRADVEGKIHKLIDSLVNIKDETGEFLLKLDDGRVIDTKGWNDWEVGCFRYPIWHFSLHLFI